MNPMLMLLLMQPHRGRQPSSAALVAMGLIYAITWSAMLLLLFGATGLIIGWPCTIAVCAILGLCMGCFDMTPGDLAGVMIHVVLGVALVMMGLFMFL